MMHSFRSGLLFWITGATLALWGTSSVRADPAGIAGACAPGTLGVSRVIEVDTTGGPRFGAPGPEPFPLLEDKEVVLTFDDGPMRRFTRPILEALDEECTKATFYIVGRMALSDPTTLQDTAAPKCLA